MQLQNRIVLTLGVILLFASVVAVSNAKLQGAKKDYAKLQTEFTQYKLEAEEAKAAALIKAADETERRLDKQREIINDYSNQLEALRSDFDNANNVSQRLRERIKQLTKTSCNNPISNSTPAGSGEAKSPTERIAELARLADETAGRLARELDEAVARGNACELLYQDIKEGNAHD